MSAFGRAFACALIFSFASIAASGAHAEPAAQPSSMDFDLFGDANKKPTVDPLKQAALERASRRRRRMLTAHQVFGFITLGALAATLVVGQLHYIDEFSTSGSDSGRYRVPHLGLGVASAALFTTTGILALAAPNPYKKPVRFDGALVHKIAMGLAAAGMVTQLVLGPISASHEGRLDQRDFALAHLVVGYGTFAAMAAGTLAFVF